MKAFLSSSTLRLMQLAVIGTLCLLLTLLTGCSITLNEASSNVINEEHHAAQNDAIPQNGGNNALNENNKHSNETDSSNNPTLPLTSFHDVSDYIRQYGELPDNYLTKKEAQELGWIAAQGNLHDVAPGMSIGGDRFGNREGLLPVQKGRIWYEADINYEGGRRNADRIVFSNDGLIYMTTDHYESFTDITEGMN